MKFHRFFAFNAGLALMLVCAPRVEAYEVSTHLIITDDAVTHSVLAATPQTVLADVGVQLTLPTIMALVRQGAECEDRVQADHNVCQYPASTDQQVARVFNHFFDVQFSNYEGRGLNVYSGLVRGNPSPDWALEDRGEVVAIGVGPNAIPWLRINGGQSAGMQQTRSLRHAQMQYFDLLTAQDPSYREQQTYAMFESLGSVIHHIQDMAQPQHTRNEAHRFKPNSYYESFTERKINASVPAILQNYRFPTIPQLDTARAYWYSTQSTTDHIPRYVGMAEFTAQNYVSLATGYRLPASGALTAAPGIPLPNGTNQNDGSAKSLQQLSVQIRYADGTTATENGTFVIGNVVDGIAGVPPKAKLLGAMSAFDPAMEKYQQGRVFTVSDAVFTDNYSVLLPRASAFSSGLINHLFRGRVDLRPGSGSSGWIFENKSRAGMTMNGQVSLWYEEASGLRYPFPGTNTFNIVNLLPDSANTLAAGQPPATATKVIAAFKGQIGAEPASITGGYFAVAGKVVSYSRPPIPCTTNPDTNGWSFLNLTGDGRGMNNGGSVNPGLMELGSTGGKVWGAFNARWSAGSTRWSITIRRGSASGSILYQSGFFSGLKDFSFNYGGGFQDFEHKVHVRVAPENSPNTTDSNIWDIQVGCPGVEINDGNRVQPRVTLNLSVLMPQGFCQSGQVDFYVDDNFVGPAYLQSGGPAGATSWVIPGPKVIPGAHHLRGVMNSSNTFGCGAISNVAWSIGNGTRRTFTLAGQNITVPEP